MTVCRFFQQGCCRYGNACRFEHVYVQQKYPNQVQQQSNPYQVVNQAQTNVTTEQLINQVSSDTNAAINGHQWRLSSYGPFKCKPNFPGMLDICPEELRYQMYDARTNGTIPQIEAQIAQYVAEATEKLKTISKPTGTMIGVIESLYRNETPPDPFVTNSYNNFTQNTNIFSGNNTPAPNSVFGGAAQNVSPNVASSLFAEAAQNIFQPSPTNTFGSASIFGETKPVAAIEQNNSFGAFGTGFNQQPTIPNVQQNNVFGSPNNAPTNTNVFGQTQSAVSPAALFASANNNLTPAPAPVPSNVFAQATNPQISGQSSFGNQTSSPFQQQATSSVFGMSNINVPDKNNPFGVQKTLNRCPEFYSKMEDLTEEQISAFRSDTFLPGQIPEVPPPIELCD